MDGVSPVDIKLLESLSGYPFPSDKAFRDEVKQPWARMANQKHEKACEVALQKHDEQIEALKRKYLVDVKKFFATLDKYSEDVSKLQERTKVDIGKLVAKDEKEKLAAEKKANRRKSSSASSSPVFGRIDMPGNQGIPFLVDPQEDEVSVLARELGGVVTHVADSRHSIAMSVVEDQHPGHGHTARSHEYANKYHRHPDKGKRPPKAPAAKTKKASNEAKGHRKVQKEATARSLILHLKMQGKTAEARDLEEAYKFSGSDTGWADAFFEWLADRDELPRNYKTHTHIALGETFVYDVLPAVGQPFKMGVIGDWGTGNRQSIMLANLLMSENKPDFFVHLGDVYYCGTQKQFQDFYVNPLMQAFQVKKPSDMRNRVWTLPGNHDYYAGGKPFFDTVASIGSHKGSYFCLRNQQWAVIGIDTSLNDANPIVTAEGTHCTTLPDAQLAWFRMCIADAKRHGCGVIVMSHHMLFSQHESTGSGKTLSYTNEKLYAQIGEEYISKIDLWLWGHEHSYCRYAPYRGLRRGRLLGNGGVPVMPKEKPYEVKQIPGQEPPKALSKPPQLFTIKDSLVDFQDISLYCNGAYMLEFGGNGELVLQYHELRQKGAGGGWTLDPVPEERETFILVDGKLEDKKQ